MLSPSLLALLRTYWKAVRPHEWLFPGRGPDTHLSIRSVQRVCHDTWQRSGLTKQVNVHMLRTVSTYYYSFQRTLYFSGSSACPTTG